MSQTCRKMTIKFESSANLASFLVALTKKNFEDRGAKVIEAKLE